MRDTGVRDVRTLADVHEIVLPAVGATYDNTSPTMDPFVVMEDDHVKVSAVLVPHGPIFPAFAFRFDTTHGSVTFSGDTTYSDNLVPYDPDPQIYSTLHSSYAQAGIGSPYDNASGYVNPAVDAALDAARRTTDLDERAAQYRSIQSAYVADPGYVMLVFLDHTYVSRNTEYTGSTPILEPHSHGASWGPWWNLREWTRS